MSELFDRMIQGGYEMVTHLSLIHIWVVTSRERERSWRVAAVNRAVVARSLESVRVDTPETFQPREETRTDSSDRATTARFKMCIRDRH